MKFRHRRHIFRYTPALLFIAWMKKIHLRRHNVSLYKVVKVFSKNVAKDEILERASGVSFSFILAIFPAVIFLFTMIPYISVFVPEVSTDTIMNFLAQIIPSSMFDVIESTVIDIISNQRGGLLTFGFVFSLYLSTNGMQSLMRAFNACYKTVESRGWLRMRITATGLTVFLAIVLIFSIALLVVGQLTLDYVVENLPEMKWFNPGNYTVYLLLGLRFVVVFISFFFAISFIYYFGPAIHYNWRFFSPGSIIATGLILGVSYGFSYYITNFASYNRVYGSIGALIAMMVWVQLVTIMLMVGYEINVSMHSAAKRQALIEGRRRRRKTHPQTHAVKSPVAQKS